MVDYKCSDAAAWKESLSSYESRIESLNKPNLVTFDQFYRNELPSLIQQRNPNPHITTPELSKLMQWKLSRGKWRPRLLDFVSSLDDQVVKTASQKAFQSLPDISKAISELTVLKGVGPATASAVLAAFAPQVAPFMSDEAMVAALGNSKDYSLKQYLAFANLLQIKAKLPICLNFDSQFNLMSLPVEPSQTVEMPSAKSAKELSSEEFSFTPSDVERALWSSAIGSKLSSSSNPNPNNNASRKAKRKRKL